MTRPDMTGTQLLTLLAESVVQLHLRGSAPQFSLPYPDAVQRALDLVGFACLTVEASPPASVAELMRWCAARAIREWPVPLDTGLVSPESRLVDRKTRFPTMACAELTSCAASGGVRRLARQIFDEATAGRSPQVVEACRDLLLGYVVTDEDTQWTLLGDARQAMAWKLVGGLYEAPPKSYVVDRTISVCRTCGTLAVPLPGNELWCEAEGCPRTAGVTRYDAARVRVLGYPLRVCFSLAGRTELDARSRLREQGYAVDPIPDRLGGYRVANAAGTWTVRFHDRAEPVLHALELAEESGACPGDELIIMPHRAFTRRPDYQAAFAAALPREVPIALVPDDLVPQTFGPGRDHHVRSSHA